MVFNDWMKLSVTEDEEGIVTHGIVPFAPEIEKKDKQEGTISM